MLDAASRVLRDPDRRRRPAPAATSLVGREAELAAIEALLTDPTVRLVTITGRSGAGKTRLAEEVASRLGPELPGGAVLVDLDAVERPALVATHLAAALDLRHGAGADPDETLRRFLRYTPTLLLVDDADAVDGAAAAILALLGDDEPATRVLATASGPLRLPGERVLRLAPLAIPRPGATAGDIAASPAVALFCERAAAVDTAFRLTEANAADLAALCDRLDGLPLALELAAARIATLDPAAQLAMLQRAGALDLKPRRGGDGRTGSGRTGDGRTGSGRGQTLRDAIAWSHRLAGDAEQRVLRRLGVFGGSADLDAIEAVCETGEGDHVLDAVMELVDLHLVEPDRAPGAAAEPRFRLQPTIGEFARERLVAAGERERVEAAYLDHYLGIAASTRDLTEAAGLEILEREQDNLLPVLGRLVVAGDLARGLALAADLGPMWEKRGYFPELRAWAERLLAGAAAAPPGTVPLDVHARALAWSVTLEVQWEAASERAAEVAARSRQALDMARASGDTTSLLWALWAATGSVFVTRDMAFAAAAAHEGLAIARALGDMEWSAAFEYIAGMASQAQGNLEGAARLGAAAVEHGQAAGLHEAVIRAGWMLDILPPATPGMPAARPSLAELLALAHETGDTPAQSWLRGGMAIRRIFEGDEEGAARWSIEALRLASRTGSWFGPALPQAALAIAAAGRGHPAMTARLHAPVTRVEAALMTSISEAGPVYLGAVASARATLGAAEFDRIVAESLAAGWDENLRTAMAYAETLAGAAPDVAPTPRTPAAGASAPVVIELEGGFTERLTPREADVLRELAQGASNNEIAERLGLRPKTVMHHCASIYAKLGVRGRAEATAWAFRNGFMKTGRPG